MIKVFISYSWDSEEHKERVRALADRLQEEGLEVFLDVYAGTPPEGWPKWMERNICEADFVVLVCTQTYDARVDGKETQGKGLGVKWESDLIYNQIYHADGINTKFIPVLFSINDKAAIPLPLQEDSFYVINSEEGYRNLYWRLTKQDQIPKPQRGAIKTRPPVERPTLFPSSASTENQAAQPLSPSTGQPSVPASGAAQSRLSPVKPAPKLKKSIAVFWLLVGLIVVGGGGWYAYSSITTQRMEFVWIREGKFKMGCDTSECANNEKPVHEIAVNGFWMGTTEVTNAQYRKFNPKHKSGDGENTGFDGKNQPVVNVSWNDANAYAVWLTEQSGGQYLYRLPTEAEWEYAARAKTLTTYNFGDDANKLQDYAWYSQNSQGKTHPVGQKTPNAWGLHDMHGNVWEWCQDFYGPYSAKAASNPQGPTTGDDHVLRGGSWAVEAMSCRVTNRHNAPPTHEHPRVGFRLVRIRR